MNIKNNWNQFLTFVHNEKKQLSLSLLFMVCFIPWICTLILNHNKSHSSIQEDIAKEIIRFHVIANSDREEDQNLKIKVKDAVVTSLKPLLENSPSIEESRNILNKNLSLIEEISKSIIRENGYDYSVHVSLSSTYFPLKIYGEYAFPPGNYEALRVEIGEAEGQNWWCVMFPPLCFIDSTYSIVDSKSEQKLEQILSDEEMSALKYQKPPIKYRSKILKTVKNFFQ